MCDGIGRLPTVVAMAVSHLKIVVPTQSGQGSESHLHTGSVIFVQEWPFGAACGEALVGENLRLANPRAVVDKGKILFLVSCIGAEGDAFRIAAEAIVCT